MTLQGNFELPEVPCDQLGLIPQDRDDDATERRPVGATIFRAIRMLRVALLWRRWSQLPPRRRHVFAVVCGVLCGVGVALMVHRIEPPGLGVGLPGTLALDTSSRIEPANRPIVVPVRTRSALEIASLSTRHRRNHARRAAEQVLPAIRAERRRVAVIKLVDVPLRFGALPAADRRVLEMAAGLDAAERYETAVAGFLDELVDAVERQEPKAILAVLGLPVEPEEAGMSLAAAQMINDRYDAVIERVGPFVPARRFVVFGSTLDERTLAGMGMREALRLRHGRPIIFQTNRTWRALVTDEPTGGRDYQLEALLAD